MVRIAFKNRERQKGESKVPLSLTASGQVPAKMRYGRVPLDVLRMAALLNKSCYAVISQLGGTVGMLGGEIFQL